MTNSSPLLSVIVPVYKVEEYLPKCIESILHQTYENLEILLVDDGSPDRCPELCEEYGKQDSRIRVIHKKNEGQAIARNLALDLCRGEYVSFVDSDDWIEPETYETMLEAMGRTGADIACCGRYNVKQSTGERTLGLCPRKEELLSAEAMLERMLTWQDCDCSPCDKVFRTRVFEGLRFPVRSGSEDVGILYRLVIAAGNTVLVPRPFYNYLQRSQSTSYGDPEKMFRFAEQTEQLYSYICRNLPAAKKPARYIRVRSLALSLVLLDQGSPEMRREYGVPMQKNRRELRSHCLFLLTSPYFGNQERVTDLLMAFGLYRFFRRFFHRT